MCTLPPHRALGYGVQNYHASMRGSSCQHWAVEGSRKCARSRREVAVAAGWLAALGPQFRNRLQGLPRPKDTSKNILSESKSIPSHLVDIAVSVHAFTAASHPAKEATP